MLSILVDFNDIEQGTVTGLCSEVTGQNGISAQPGVGISLTDGEGNWCWGTILDVHDGLVSVELDLSTWTTEQPLTLDSSSANGAGARMRLLGLTFGGSSSSGSPVRGTRRVVPIT
jgi:hypothetical protein